MLKLWQTVAILLLFNAACSMSAQTAASDVPADVWADINAFITDVLACANVPGAAVGIVHKGKEVFLESFGLRDAGGAKVTLDTVFGIGSTSKAFTSALAGMLRDDKRIDLDRSLHEALPAFKLLDPIADNLVSMRDLLTHRTGVPTTVDSVPPGTLREQAIYALRYFAPTAQIRTKFQYQNQMIATAGYALGHVANSTWDELVQTRIFDPLGMSSSFPTYRSAEDAGVELAQPIYWDDKAKTWMNINREPNHIVDIFAPAGAINSNVKDMSKWAAFQLAKGKSASGAQLLQPATWADMHSPHALAYEDDAALTRSQWEMRNLVSSGGYGLCWGTSSYRGKRRSSHNGATTGFLALVSLLLDDDLGIVILTNAYSVRQPYFRDVIASYVYDRVLGLTPMIANSTAACHFPCMNWPDLCPKAGEASIALGESQQSLSHAFDPVVPFGASAILSSSLASRAAVPDSSMLSASPFPAGPLSDYVGSYSHPYFGNVVISINAEQQLFAQLQYYQGVLTPMAANSDSFSLAITNKFLPDPPSPAGVHRIIFRRSADANNKVVTARWNFPPNNNFIFVAPAFSPAQDGDGAACALNPGSGVVVINAQGTIPEPESSNTVSRSALVGMFFASIVLATIVSAGVTVLAITFCARRKPEGLLHSISHH